MDLGEIEQLRDELAAFVAEVFASVPRRDQRAKGDCYLRGLMLDGRRKSIQPMAERLPDGDMQALQQFVNQSPWDHTAVLRAVALKTVAAVDPPLFSRSGAWTQKPQRRPDLLPGPGHTPGPHPRMDRRVPHLPPRHPRRSATRTPPTRPT